MFSDAVLTAEAFEHAGVNVTLIAHDPPGATPFEAALPVQLSVSLKSAAFVPANEMLLMMSAPVPESDTVIATGALGVATVWLPKLTLLGERATAGAVPVPLTATDCGLSGASSEMLIDAVRAPAADGSFVSDRAWREPHFERAHAARIDRRGRASTGIA